MSDLQPGRELDELIATKIFGCWVYKENGPDWLAVQSVSHPTADGGSYLEGHSEPLPHYSTDIAAALELAESLRYRPGIGKRRLVLCDISGPVHGAYRVQFVDGDGQHHGANEVAETAAHAICLAALKAVGATD